MSTLRAAVLTTLNILLNALTLGRFLLLEGRVSGGVFKNWAHGWRHRPRSFVRPKSEAEIVQLIQGAGTVRAFGSGHSFNGGVVADDVLVSLDDYAGVVAEDLSGPRKTVTFRAGTRVRDVISALFERGLAFEALPSHDAQSIAGILSSDVHGTGNDWGFVSQCVTRLRIVDGTGTAFDCDPDDDRFKAAIGGVGAIGLIVEVTVEAVPRFDVEQIFRVVDEDTVEKNFEQILSKYRHVSLYIFPFTERCQISIWNPVVPPVRSKSFLGPLREWVAISVDALAAAWVGGIVARLRLLPALSGILHRLKRGTDLVMESNRAFNRTIYHLHQEMEFTVPFEETWDRCREFIRLYEDVYRESGLPYGFLEVRFTPAGHDRTLIGAGRKDHSTWIDIIMNDESGFEKLYARAEDVVRKIGARPHLGKYCETLDAAHLKSVHGEHFDRFQELVAEHDPKGRLQNDFTRRMLS